MVAAMLAACGRAPAPRARLGTALPAIAHEDRAYAGRIAQPLDPSRLAALAGFVELARAQARVPGVAIAIVDHGQVVLAHGFGVRQLGRPEPVTPDTLFLIGSTTKPLTTLMMARLVDEQRFAWDSPLEALAPGLARPGQALPGQALPGQALPGQALPGLTVAHTVCACSGMPGDGGELIFAYAAATPEQRIAELARRPPSAAPGRVFQYSNAMFAAGGYWAAHTVWPALRIGDAYDLAMQRYVFAPLGMASTTFDVRVVEARDHATPHGRTRALDHVAIPLADEQMVDAIRPAAGAWSSAADLARYLALELADGRDRGGARLVSAASLHRRRAPMVRVGGRTSYGLGLFVEDDHGVTIVGHGGNTFGFSTDLFFLPDAGIGAVILTNAGFDRTLPDVVRQRLLELVFGAPDRASRALRDAVARRDAAAARALVDATPALPPALAARLVGRYANPQLGSITLARLGGYVVLDVGEWRSRIALAAGQTLVLLDPPAVDTELHLEPRAGGRLALGVDEGGQHYTFAPVD